MNKSRSRSSSGREIEYQEELKVIRGREENALPVPV
jgi:hypothetical protein